MSASGTYAVLQKDYSLTRIARVTSTLSAAEFNAGVSFPMPHYDLGIDASGADIAYDAGKPRMVRLSDGLATTLGGPSNITNYFHSSTRNVAAPGWAFASMDAPKANGGYSSALDREVYAHQLKSGGGIKRLVNTYGSTSTAYERMTAAVPSPDGLRVFYRSDWGNGSGAIYGFVVDARTLCAGQ